MLIAIVWPAVISASKIICRQKPIAAPISTSCATMKPARSEISNGGVNGTSGDSTYVAATANASRVRIGTSRAPNTGATITTPAIRKNGQTLTASSRENRASSMSSGICMTLRCARVS